MGARTKICLGGNHKKGHHIEKKTLHKENKGLPHEEFIFMGGGVATVCSCPAGYEGGTRMPCSPPLLKLV